MQEVPMPAQKKSSGQEPKRLTQPVANPLQQFRHAHTALGEQIISSIENARKRAREADREHTRLILEMDDDFARQRTGRVRNYVGSERGDSTSLRSERVAVEDELEQLDEEFRKREREALSKREEIIENTRRLVRQDIQRAFKQYVASINA